MSAPSPGSDPAALETILFACLDVAPAEQEAALAAACLRHPALADSLRRCWQRIRHLQPAASGLPTQVAGHRILSRLGGGGMGVVYLAEQERLHRKVAVKLIRSDLLESPAARERFQREAQAASKVDHPGLCPVFEVGEADGVPFLVMPFLEGQTLAARIAELAAVRGPSPTSAMSTASRDLVSVVAAVARAAHHAHEHGLVHRDIKPGNIMLLADGRPMLLDFGLARDTTSDEMTLTHTGERVGTPAYMAPEQLRGDAAIDRRTDVYALGIVLYEVALLERPFDGSDVLMLREQIASGIRPAQLRRRVPFDLASIVLKAADPEPARRYATAAELADDLERFLRLEPVSARRLGALGRALRWARRYPVVAALLVALVVALGFAGAALRSSLREQRANAAQALLGESRLAERTDPKLAVAKARAADELDPTPQSLVQMNRAVAAQREVHRFELGAPVRCVALTPDGERLLAVTKSGSLYVYEVASFALVAKVAPPQEGFDLAFATASRDRSVVVFGGKGRAWIWRPSQGDCRPLMHPGDPENPGAIGVVAAAASEDGTAFTIDAHGQVARWTPDATLASSFPWFVHPGKAPELSIGGDRLVIGSDQGLALVPLADGEPVRTRTKGPTLFLSVAPPAQRLFAAQLGVGGVFDFAGEHVDLFGPELRYFGGHLDPTGKHLAIAHRGSVRVYDFAAAGAGLDGIERASYRDAFVGKGPVGLVRFADDGSRLFAMAEDNVLRMYDGEGEELLALPGFAQPARTLDYHARTQLLVTGDESGLLRVWDVRTSRPMPPSFQVPKGVYNGLATDCTDPLIARRDNGRLIAFPLDGGAPWDIEAGNYLLQDARVERRGNRLALALRAGRGLPLDAAQGAATAKVWDLASNELAWMSPVDLARPPIGVDFLPGNRLLVVTSGNPGAGAVAAVPCELRIWGLDGRVREPAATFVCPAEWGLLAHGAATPDGRHVVLGTRANKVCVVPLDLSATPPAFGVPRAFDAGAPVPQLDVARQGDRFVAACDDRSARIFDLQGRLLARLVGHENRVVRAHFSPSGQWVVTASLDGSARVWDSRSGEERMAIVVGDPSPVWDALFRADEQVLYTVSLDGVVRGWLLDRQELRRLSVAPAPR